MSNKFQFDEDILDEKVEESIEVVKVPEKVTVEAVDKENEEPPKEEISMSIIKKFYFGFEARIFVSIIVILLLFAGACFLGLKVINHKATRRIKYEENGNIYYQVNLKDSVSTTEDITFNAVDLKNIKMTFDYVAKYDEGIKKNNYYKITSIVSMYSRDTHSLLTQEDNDLVEKKILPLLNEKYPITEVVDIDYKKYKKKYENYKDLDIQLEVAFYLIQGNETRKVSGLVIPLTKDNFELRKYTTINATREIEEKVNIWDTYSLVYGIAASLLTLVSLILIYRTTRLVLKVTNTKSEYEEALEALLKNYNSIITVAGEGFESIVPEEKEVVKFDNFEELAKVSEEINKQIVYSKINNVKSEFILESDDKLYKYVMKEADLVEDDKNKLENK